MNERVVRPPEWAPTPEAAQNRARPGGGVSIRNVTSADLPEVLGLVRNVLTTSLEANAVSIQSFMNNAHKNALSAIAHPDKCVHLVATLEGVVVGVVLIKEYWNLCSLFVHPSMHGQGVGKSLLGRAVEAAKEVNSNQPIELYAVPAAIGFYFKSGFAPTGRSLEGTVHMTLQAKVQR